MEETSITWLDPQVKDVTINIDMLPAFSWTPETKVGHDDDGNLVLLNMRENATGEIKSMKLTGLRLMNPCTSRDADDTGVFTASFTYGKP